MKIALISLYQKWEDKAHNLRRCSELTGIAVANGAELVIFPEMTLTGFTMDTALSAEDYGSSPSLNAFSALARQHAVCILAGFAIRQGGKAANTLVAFSGEGNTIARYEKIHPFSFSGEDQFFQGGNRLSKIRLGEINIGLTICYDLRFPELYSALAKDCDVLVNIANWPRRRVSHWRTLLQARAIENQAFVIGVNRTGLDGNGIEYERSSLIADADGKTLAPTMTEGEIDIFNLDHSKLLEFRRGFSTFQDRLPGLYKAFL